MEGTLPSGGHFSGGAIKSGWAAICDWRGGHLGVDTSTWLSLGGSDIPMSAGDWCGGAGRVPPSGSASARNGPTRPGPAAEPLPARRPFQ